MTRLCFIHGWAYGPDIWADLEKEFAGHDITKIDLGFLGAKAAHNTADKTHETHEPFDVVIAHSYGLMWLLKNDTITFNKLISLSGIASFVQSPECLNGVPKSQLRAMRKGLKDDPQALLDGFYKACEDTHMQLPQKPNIAALDDALGDMATLDLREKLHALNTYALASKHDNIVSAKLTTENFASKPILWHDSTSHILSKTHAPWCAARIKDIVNA